MTMGAKVFIDTNMLIRAFHNQFSEHIRARALFDQLLDDDYEVWIGRQVIREYLVQITHPNTFVNPLSIQNVLAQLNNIRKIFQIADETEYTTNKLADLLLEYPTKGKLIHDANLIATMLVNGIDTLATFNVSDFKRFSDKIKIITPNGII